MAYFLPPAPNWYKPFATGGSDAGFYCFAAKNTVVVLDARRGAPTQRSSWVVGPEVVTCAVFCRSARADVDQVPAVLTVSSDGSIRVWNVADRTVQSTAQSQSATCCADWRGNMSTSVVFSGTNGSVLVWNTDTGAAVTVGKAPGQDITILRSHPTDPDIVAVGYSSGTIVVQTLNKGTNLVYKLKGHSGSVLSLSWKVGSSAQNESTSSEPLCLCSTALDRTLKVWDVTAEKLVKTLRTPTSSKYRKGDTREKWTAASWIPGRSEAIVSSSVAGDVCIYEPGGADEGTFLTVDADSGGHSSTVYNLCIVGGAQEETPMYAVSSSIDRNIVFWDLAAKKSAYCIPCLGGFAYSLVFSPIACATLAVASGDSSVKIWRTDCVKNPYSSKVITLGRKDRVHCVAWHPKKENILALGTSEGKVCVVDVNTRHVTVSQSHHTSATYVVCWADLVVGQEGSLKTFLLSCGSSRVKIHEFPKLDNNAPDIESILSNPGPSRAKRTSLTFNTALGILTISNLDGLVELYKVNESPTLKKVATLEAQRKPAECLVWHPSQAPFSDCNSRLMYWLACSSIGGQIFVYNLSLLATPSTDVHRILQPTLQLSGHSGKVVSLAWSPFQETLLASASYDRTVQVWDVGKAQLVATYQGHSARVFSVSWSPVDPDVLFSGGEDNVIRSWKLSEQPVKPVRPPKPPEKAGKQEAGAIAPLANVKDTTNEITPPKKDVDADNQSTGSAPATTSSKASTSGSKKKAKRMASYFPYSSHFDNLPKESRSNDVQYLADLLAKSQLEAVQLDPEHSHLGTYTNKRGALGVLDAEIAHHKKEHNLDHAFQMMAWKGDLVGALKEAAAERRLTDTLVALAPMVSRFVWIETCEQYAIQLASEGEHHRAALYFLACRKSTEAVKLLCSNNLHREAVAIARANFSESSPEIREVYESWAARAASVGNFEQAAKCYLAIGNAGKAVAFLLNRRDPHSLRSAAYIAKRNGLSAEAEMAFQTALQCSLIHNQWEEAALFVEEHKKSPAFLTFIKLHKALVEAVNAIDQTKVDTANGHDSTDRVLWSSQDGPAAAFLSAVVEAYESHGSGPPLKSTDGFAELSGLLGLEKHVLKEVLANETREHMLFHVAGLLGVALFSPDQWKLYLARALATAHTHNHPLYLILCQLLFHAKVIDSAFADGAAVSVETRRCLLFDKLEGTSNTPPPTFECPPSSASLWANFRTLTGNTSAQYLDPAREALLLYLCDAILCKCAQEEESTTVRASIARELSALALSPTIACLEHLSYKYLAAEKNLLSSITEELNKKHVRKDPGTAKDEASPQSLLENEVQVCKKRLQEMKAATSDCPFPEQTSVLRRLVQLLGSASDKSYVGLKTTLEAWMQLVLDV